jgi:hypothetical protein
VDQVSHHGGTHHHHTFDRSRKEGMSEEGVAEDVDIDGRDTDLDPRCTKFPIIMHRDNLEISSINSPSFATL